MGSFNGQGTRQGRLGPRYFPFHWMFNRYIPFFATVFGMGTLVSLFFCLSLLSLALLFGGCAATGGAAVAAKEAVCAVHNSVEMINLCENPVRK